MTRSAEDIELIQCFIEESETNLPEVERMLEVLRPFEFSQPFDILEYISFMSSRDVPEYRESLRVINCYVHTEIKIHLDEIQNKDFGLVRQTQKSIKVSVGLEVYDRMVGNFQDKSHAMVEMLRGRGLEPDLVFEIGVPIANGQNHTILKSIPFTLPC